jgi:hypothetical protein
MKSSTFTITGTSGVSALKMDAGGSLEPLPDGSYIRTSPGATAVESAKRPHLRLVR